MNPGRTRTLEREIAFVRAKIRKRDAYIQRFFDTVAGVCPCCQMAALGGSHNVPLNAAIAKQDRAEEWLKILLQKRRGPRPLPVPTWEVFAKGLTGADRARLLGYVVDEKVAMRPVEPRSHDEWSALVESLRSTGCAVRTLEAV